MADSNDKLRPLILVALMVFSVFAGTVALSGAAATDNPDTESNQDTSENTKQDCDSVSQTEHQAVTFMLIVVSVALILSNVSRL